MVSVTAEVAPLVSYRSMLLLDTDRPDWGRGLLQENRLGMLKKIKYGRNIVSIFLGLL